MLGNERRPSEKHIQDYFRDYEVFMDKNNINFEVVEIEVPKILCARNLGNLRVAPTYDGPVWRADENAQDKVDGVDEVTPFDIDLFCALCQICKQNGLKQKIKIKVNKNIKQMLMSEGIL